VYRMTLTVQQVMTGYAVVATLYEDDWESGDYAEISSSSESVVTFPNDADDAFRTLLLAIRVWADDAVLDSHK